MFSPFRLKIICFPRERIRSLFLLVTNAVCELQNDDCGLVIGALWISPLNSCIADGSCG